MHEEASLASSWKIAFDAASRYLEKDINGVKHFFISYSRLDAEFGENLIYRLRAQGFDTWVDTEQIQPGHDWRKSIDEAIRTSAAVIVVMTPAAKASEYVTYEWAYALGAGVPVIPVLLDRIDLHPVLAALQYLEFTVPIHLRPWERLFDSIRAVMAKETTKVHLTPDEIQALVAGFDNANPAVRREAVGILATTDQDNAREALGGALQHPRRDVRLEAAIRLVETGQPEPARVIPILMEGLYGPTEEISERASQALIHIGTPAVTSLTAILRSQDAQLTQYAVKILRELRSATAVPALTELLHQQTERFTSYLLTNSYIHNDYMLIDILKALGDIGHSDATTSIITLLERITLGKDIIDVVSEIMKEIGSISSSSLNIDLLIRIRSIIRESIYAAQAIRPPAVSGIVGLMERLILRMEQSDISGTITLDKDILAYFFIGSASKALGIIGDPEAVPVLLRTLQLSIRLDERHLPYRLYSAFEFRELQIEFENLQTTIRFALLEVGGPVVIAGLRRLLHDPACSPNLQSTVRHLLQRLGVTEV